jgi:hypothetical protein
MIHLSKLVGSRMKFHSTFCEIAGYPKEHCEKVHRAVQ